MKVGIITCFDAVNYGSFLQAFALQRVLKNLGATEVKMIKTSSWLYEKWRYTTLFTYKPSKMKFKFKLANGYFKIWEKFDITRNKKGYDLVIVGSDEMWNLNNITMKSLPEFFGIGIETKRLISYAVSCNNTTSFDVEKNECAKKGIKQFDQISVRDIATYEAYKPFSKKEIRIDIDPTLLIDLNKYIVPIADKEYILVYTYGFEEYMKNGVLQLAKRLKKKVIIAGQNFDWGDEKLAANAFQFLGLLKNADVVITDTFHGTVLSLALEKQVLSFANHKPKVYRIMEQFEILHRNVSGMADLWEAYENKIDYNEVNLKLTKLREFSLKYLEENLKM